MIDGNNSLPQLADGWIWTKLEDCVDVFDGQRVPINAEERERRVDGKSKLELYPYYGATGQVGWIDGFLFDEELVLLGEDGAPFFEPTKNKAYIIKGKSWVNNHAHVLRAIAEITSNWFLCHYLNVFNYAGYVGGTTRPKLNQAPMRKIPIPLPPLPEQHRIVAKIEELLTRLDAGEEALKKVKAQLKVYCQAVLKHAFEGKLTEEWREAHKGQTESASVLLERIKEERGKKGEGKLKELPPLNTSDLSQLPEGWVWTRLGEVGSVASGGTPSTKDEGNFGGEIPWLTPADLTDFKGKFISRGKRNLTRKGLDSSSAVLLPVGTVLFSSRAPIGYVAIASNPISTNQGFKNLVPFEGIFNEYVFHYLKSSKQLAESYASGTTFSEISGTRFGQLPIPLSPLTEQHRIVEEIERCFSVADEIERVVEQSLMRAERLRQSILKRAFEGKLMPQDPTDEPAEKLLERIRVERAGRQVEKKATGKGRNKLNTKQGRLM